MLNNKAMRLKIGLYGNDDLFKHELFQLAIGASCNFTLKLQI